MGMAIRMLGDMLSAGRQLLVLTYHRVLEQPDPLLPEEVDVGRFDSQVRFLAEHFRLLPLSEAVARLHSRSLPARAVCITMDDGYANNCEVALPVLRRYEAPATCFVASGFIDSGLMWNDRVIEAVRLTPHPCLELESAQLGRHPVGSVQQRGAAINALLEAIKYLEPEARLARVEQIVAACGVTLPRNLMMSSEQIRALDRGGVEIGGHTVTHPILTRIDDARAREEIAEGRERLVDILRAPVRTFAYPNGRPGRDYAARHVSMVRGAGFEAAVSTAWGPARASSGAFQVPRIAPWDRSAAAFGLRLIRSYAQRGVAVA